MTYYFIQYEDQGSPKEVAREEFTNSTEAYKALGSAIGFENLVIAMRMNNDDLIYWTIDGDGYAVATEFEVDPIDG